MIRCTRRITGSSRSGRQVIRWIDVSGPPGVGKSTLCDALWPPRGIALDGEPYPGSWAAFLACTEKLLERVRHHESYGPCASMIKRSFRKMATVSRLPGAAVYIQTGFVQRGLGLGWRLEDPEEVAPYYELMPVSLGVVLLKADIVTVQRRNVERGKDRSHMVPHMQRPLDIAGEIFKARGIPLLELDTRRPIDECKNDLAEFARLCAGAPGA